MPRRILPRRDADPTRYSARPPDTRVKRSAYNVCRSEFQSLSNITASSRSRSCDSRSLQPSVIRDPPEKLPGHLNVSGTRPSSIFVQQRISHRKGSLSRTQPLKLSERGAQTLSYCWRKFRNVSSETSPQTFKDTSRIDRFSGQLAYFGRTFAPSKPDYYNDRPNVSYVRTNGSSRRKRDFSKIKTRFSYAVNSNANETPSGRSINDRA